MIFFVRNPRIISAVELKKREAGASILGVIVSELSHRKESGPIILLEVDEGSKIGFYRTILPFSLSAVWR